MESIWCLVILVIKLLLSGSCFFISTSNTLRSHRLRQSSLDSDPNGYLTDWTPSSPSPCSWRAVSCSVDGRVTALILTNVCLIGTLRLSDLTPLPTLAYLHFVGNSFFSNFSFPGAASYPYQTLDFSANNFSDPLPPAVESSLLSYRRLLSLKFTDNSIPGGALDFGPSLLQLNRSRNRIFNFFLLTHSRSFCHNLNLLNLSHNELAGKLDGTVSSARVSGLSTSLSIV